MTPPTTAQRTEDTHADEDVSSSLDSSHHDLLDPARRYSVSKLDGLFTLQELAQMELDKDPRLTKVRRRDLPKEFWDVWRKARNRRRTLKQKEARRAKHAEQQQRGGGELQGVPEHGRPQRTKEMREQAVQAHLAQKARVAQALGGAGLRVAVDCSLCHAGASWREVRSLAKQLQLCVGANKKARVPLNLHFVGVSGAVREFAVEHMNALLWAGCHLEEAPALDLFPRDQLVLLSPDAEQPLTELDPAKVYVIGGLVDRSPVKNATAGFAEQHGITCVRLPILECLEQPQQPQQPQQAQRGPQQAQWVEDCPQKQGQQVTERRQQAEQAEECPQQQAQLELQHHLQPAQQGHHAPDPAQQPQESSDDEQPARRQAPQARQPQPGQQQREAGPGQAAGAAASAGLQGGCCEQVVHSGDTPAAAPQQPSPQSPHSVPDHAQHTSAPAGAARSCDAGVDAGAGARQKRKQAGKQAERKDGKGFILNINDVVEVLLAVSAGEGWGDSLRATIPQRKQQQGFGSGAELAKVQVEP